MLQCFSYNVLVDTGYHNNHTNIKNSLYTARFIRLHVSTA